MSYSSVLQKLLSLKDLERIAGPPVREYKLERMRILAQLLGNPHAVTPTIHVTGTKGKGSTAAMIASILDYAGITPGLYTSPHLHTFRERIRLGLVPITEAMFSDLFDQVWCVAEEMSHDSALGRITTFEALTAMAFLCFAQTRRQFQVLEVGLGGTLDATNIVDNSTICVFAPISLDHTRILGDTIFKIASDKAGIIKPGAVVIVSPQEPEVINLLREVCEEKKATFVAVQEEFKWSMVAKDLTGQSFRFSGLGRSGNVRIPLLGRHQIWNACAALAAIYSLVDLGIKISDHSIMAGLDQLVWAGRLEVLGESPTIVGDGAHNPYSMKVLVDSVKEYLPQRKIILVFGFSSGHDLDGVIREAIALNPKQVIACRAEHPRSISETEIAERFIDNGIMTKTSENVRLAVSRALAQADGEDLVLVAGSLFVVAEAREYLKGITPEAYG